MTRKGFKLWQELLLGTAVIAAIGYALLTLVPQALTPLVPHSAWTRLGDQLLTGVTGGSPPCPAGHEFLDQMHSRLVGGESGEPVAIEFYVSPVMNAWALPGGRIVVTSGLVARAGTPEEVAGVLAHEIGHVRGRHAEGQFIRELAISVLAGLAGNDGLAAPLAVLGYSRHDEAAADQTAEDLLTSSGIGTAGLRAFLTRVQDEEEPEFLGRLGNLLSTHPVTQDRIDALELVDNKTPVLSPSDWAALKASCG